MKVKGKTPVDVIQRVTYLAMKSKMSNRAKDLLLSLVRLAIEEKGEISTPAILSTIKLGMNKSMSQKRTRLKRLLSTQEREEKRVKELIKNIQASLKDRR